MQAILRESAVVKIIPATLTVRDKNKVDTAIGHCPVDIQGGHSNRMTD